MSKSFEEWYKKHGLEIYWYQYRSIMGFDPEKPESFEEIMYWKRVKKMRDKCSNSNDPHYAITNAPSFDKQSHLKKWWEDLNRLDKEKYLIHVWFGKMNGLMYGLDWWIPFFEDVGFITNCDTYRPHEPITLYRGTEPYFQQSMSWTTNLDMARTFADSTSLMGDKNVYKTTVKPESILAIFKGNAVDRNGEMLREHGLEYVINHQDLKYDDIVEINSSK